MATISTRTRLWKRRKKGTRKRLGRVERPLLTVYRSSRHIYAQIVDPISGRTVTGISTRSPAVREALEREGAGSSTKDTSAAKHVGANIAKLALDRSINEVTFNRNGFVFAGRIKALADAAREAGLNF